MLLQFVDLISDAFQGLGVTDVVGLDIWQCQHGIIDGQLRIESQGTKRGEEESVFLVVLRIYIMRHEASQIGYDDAIVAQQKYLNMSFQFNHVCKIKAFFGNKQIKET